MRTTRYVELDFLRGLALLIILVDHIGGSVLTRATLHTYALCDASELFVFLAGLSAALAHERAVERGGAQRAGRRLLRRAGVLYGAFLITAALMLALGALFTRIDLHGPNLPQADGQALRNAPFATLLDLALLKRQPYLSAILPMYICYTLAAVWMLPLARRHPLPLLAASAMLWLCAPALIPVLGGGAPWDFNPYAWQLLFVLGVLAARGRSTADVLPPRLAWCMTALALAVAAAGVWARLSLPPFVSAAGFKSNLDLARIANFAALAWLTHGMARRGWLTLATQALPVIVRVGQHGLISFIAGAAISLVIDTLLHVTTQGLADWPLGALADVIALLLLFGLAQTLTARPARRAPQVVRGSTPHDAVERATVQ